MPDRSRYRRAIIDAFATKTDEWDLDVLAGVLMRFADEGDAEAGQILRYSLDRLPDGVLDTVGYRFVQLDGLSTFPALAARLGDAAGYWLRAQAEDEFGAEAVAAVLASSTDPRVMAFDLATGPSREPREPRARESLDEFVSALNAGRYWRSTHWFERNAEPAELARLVDLIEAGHRHLAALLRIGARVPFPRMPSNLLALAESPDPDIADAAIDALAHFLGPDTLAVRRRLVDAGVQAAVELLAGASDEEIRALPSRFAYLTDAEDIHRLGMDLLDLSKARGSIEPSLLVWMAEATPAASAGAVRLSASPLRTPFRRI